MAKSNAESLRDILELARTRRLNGVLTIEHTHAGKVEEGEVFLQSGQPVQARVGRLVGQDALNWIMRWHRIRYSIGTDESLESVATTNVGNRNDTTPSTTLPYVPPKRIPSPDSVVAKVQVNSRGPILSNTSIPGVEWLIPQKRGIEREVLALPLTRRQRFIYFLVDGRRTVADLARCTGKNTQEIELILSELQEQGLVAV